VSDNPFSKFDPAPAAGGSDNPFAKFDPPPSKAEIGRWDYPGAVGKAAGESIDALKQDTAAAFPGIKEQGAHSKELTDKYGPVGGFVADLATPFKRLGSALSIPLDALGVASSPATAAARTLIGTPLSYLPGYTKELADRDVDTAMMAARPGKFAPLRAAEALPGSAPDLTGTVKPSAARVTPTAPADVASQADAAAAASKRMDDSAASLRDKAIDKINARAAADKLTAQQVLDAQSAAATTGDKITLMDLGKKNMRGIAGSVYRAPGEAGAEINEFLEARDKAAGKALTRDIEGSVGKGSTYETAKDLATARKTAADPLYKDAYEANQAVESPALSEILDTPAGRKALRGAVTKMQDDRTLVGDPDPVLTSLVKQLTDDGQMKDPNSPLGVARGLKLRTWDYVKRALDDQISTARRAGENDEVRIKTRLKNDLVASLDNADATAVRGPDGAIVQKGKYAQARAAWSGPSQSAEAMESGKKHFARGDSDAQIADEFRQLSPSDKEFYRLGAAEAKIDSVTSAPRASDKSKRVINSDKDENRFRMLFDSDAEAQKFFDSVERKRTMFETKNAIKGGSQTAERTGEDSHVALEAALNAAHGLVETAKLNPLGATKAFLRLKRDLGIINNPKLNAEIGRILMDTKLDVNTTGTGQLLNKSAKDALRQMGQP